MVRVFTMWEKERGSPQEPTAGDAHRSEHQTHTALQENRLHTLEATPVQFVYHTCVLLCSPQPHNYIPRVYYYVINNTQLGLITWPNEVTIIIASSEIKVFLCAALTEAVSPMRLELCAGRRDVLRPTQKCFDDDIFHTHHQAWRMRCFIQIGQTAILFKNLKGEICLLSDYLSRPRWYTHLRCPCLPPGGTLA